MVYRVHYNYFQRLRHGAATKTKGEKMLDKTDKVLDIILKIVKIGVLLKLPELLEIMQKTI